MVGSITILALLGVVGSGIGYFTFIPGLKLGIDMSLNLKQDGMVYPLYMAPPFPSIATYHVYSITNPREVLRGEKMNLLAKGPYVYNVWLKRDNIAFANEGETVKYHSHRKMYLDEDASANLDERFWVLNPILPSVVKSVKSIVLDRVPFPRVAEPIVFNSVNVLLDNFKERLIVKKSARELLNGKKVDMLEFILNAADRFGLKNMVPPGPPENVFGVAHFQNNTVDIMEIYTGVGSTKKRYAEVYKWKDRDALTLWSGRCNIINGTNGELHKPFIQQGKSLKIFLGQLCRTFELDPVDKEPVKVQNDLTALEYELTKNLFKGAKSNPRNRCFCSDLRTYDCQYDGLISMAPCFFDAPLYFAQPNLKGVDRRIRSLINEDTLNQTFREKQSFWLEPITGTILKVDLTLVAMFKIVRQPYMRDLARVQNLTYAPAFIAGETIELPNSVTWQLRALQLMHDYHKPAFILVGLGWSCVLLMKFMMMSRASGSKSTKIQPQPQPQPTTTTTMDQSSDQTN